MRALKIFSTALVCMGLGALVLTACSDGDGDGIVPNPVDPIVPIDPSEGEALSSDEQKERLEQIAKGFLNEIKPTDFKQIDDLLNHVRLTYNEDYDWENVASWGEEAFDDAREFIDRTEEVNYEDPYRKYIVIYDNYKALIMASNFTGHFTAEGMRWVYSKADDLQFIFKDNEGKQCVLKLATSGAVKKVHLFNIDDWYKFEYYDESVGDYYYYRYEAYYDRTQYTIGMPENIEVSLTQDGKELVKATANINLQNIVGEEFDLSRSSLSVTSTVAFYNGYKLNVSQAAYSANRSAACSASLQKGETTLVTCAASTTVEGLPNVNLAAFGSGNYEDEAFDNANAKDAWVKIDIMGKAQIQGHLKNARNLSEYLEAAEDNDDNEVKYKNYLKSANNEMEIYLFYDNSNKTQANVTLRTFEEEYWGGYEYWTYEPVMNFYDGSSYSPFGSFFDEIYFREVINLFNRITGDFEDMVN